MNEHEKIKTRPFPKNKLGEPPAEVQEWLKTEIDPVKQIEVQPISEYTIANARLPLQEEGEPWIARLTFQGEGKPAIVTFEDGSTMEVDVKFEVVDEPK